MIITINSYCFLKQQQWIGLCLRRRNVFSVRYELYFYILFRRNYISKVLTGIWFLLRLYFFVIIHFIFCLSMYLFRILVLACNRLVLLENTKILIELNNYYYVSSLNANNFFVVPSDTVFELDVLLLLLL
jgi:hypothetical protein